MTTQLNTIIAATQNFSTMQAEQIKDLIAQYEDELVSMSDSLSGFSEACYDMNSLSELEACTSPDAEDMATWDLSGEQWLEEIEKARVALKADELLASLKKASERK